MLGFFYHSFTNPSLYRKALINCDLAKLEAFGDDYLSECIVIYLQDLRYKEYITDCLKMIAENTTKPYGGNAPNIRFADIIDPKPKAKEVKAEDIIDALNKKCGLTMIEEEGEV